MQIGRSIFYDNQTGNILVDTGEREDFIESTVEQYINSYKELAERVPDTLGVIQLKYGQYAQDFAECNGYRVDTTTHELVFSYPDPSIPEPEVPVYRKPLSEEVELLKSADLDNKEAITTLYEMLLMGTEM